MSADRNPQRRMPAEAAGRPPDDILRVADGVVHDLGNLLAVIAGQTSLLEPLLRADAEGRESVAEIKRAVSGSIARLTELAAAIRQATAAPTLLGRPIVLLVEPDSAVAERVVTFLKRGGYQVVRMAAIAEARARSADLTIDLAILSASAGDPSAVSLLDDLRSRQPRLPAVILSDARPPSPAAPEAAPTEWLTTPLAMDELARAVGRLVHEP
jgi:CheY-like chemotaxis protein